MATNSEGADALPQGIFSLLDTDLYKLTMQCAVLKYFPDVQVTYAFTNRTPDMRLTREAYTWLEEQINKLSNIALSPEELNYLKATCTYLNEPYLLFLSSFRLRPSDQIEVSFHPVSAAASNQEVGDVHITAKGLWVDTILYEIPLLALTSEAYFKFCDRDWSHTGQEENAYHKALKLLEPGCIFSEFGSRRRRDYRTQDLVIRGLKRASAEAEKKGLKGKLSGTSNVHFAMRHFITPVGTVAHEWFMGIAAYTDDYEHATETALRYWIGCFGEGVLGIALTDTFGTPVFLNAFKRPVPRYTTAASGAASILPSVAGDASTSTTGNLADTKPPVKAPIADGERGDGEAKSYAQAFAGVRQDSGDPVGFVKMMRGFYDGQGIRDKKTIVFSDSLNIDRCLEYKQAAEEHGFQPTFGIGTFLTNDFTHLSHPSKSIPLNIVIKLSSIGGKPAIKISDNIGKNTGDSHTVHEVKHRLGYMEKDWAGGDEKTRWGVANGEAK
ncbi:MAG: nicotinate phosphoribosyltransferase [Lasallia pustulata]|uniref:nicotinate phosphoribosyltransferase n=1 Tax=Lasallia pustulata TaxID=136370 RepID=A0A5M8PMY1_9LECA|nr:MAG: nicotinate phosphoribosyltransferase [Lasallia pustulata]